MAFSPAIKAFIELANEKETVASQLFSVVRDAGAREGLRLSRNDIRAVFLNGAKAEGDMLVFLGVISGDDSARYALSNGIAGAARDEGFGVMPFDATNYLLDLAAASDVPVSRALPGAREDFGRATTCAMGEEGEYPLPPPAQTSVTCAMGEEGEAPRKPSIEDGFSVTCAMGEEDGARRPSRPSKPIDLGTLTTMAVGEEDKGWPPKGRTEEKDEEPRERPIEKPRSPDITTAKVGEETPKRSTMAVGEEDKKKSPKEPPKRSTMRVGEEGKKPRKPAKPK